MAQNPNWPLMATQVAFNSGVATTTTPTWTDLTPRMWSLGCDRGRQYELDVNQAGTGQLVLADKDEALNPSNPSSPYYPNVLPYRQILVQAMWPPAPVGAAVNLINTVTGYDPTFEAYANGQALPWAGPVGGTTVLVSNVSPFAGTLCVGTGNLAAGATVQGLSLGPFPTIPGQQYTASAYVRPGGAYTVGISVQGGAAGTTTSTSGTYARLSVTFTATQPQHTILVQTSGTVTATPVKVDNLQLEPGASVSAFAATGPTIYGVHRGFVERWPAAWNHQGMYGYAQVDTVDAFAVMAARKLHTEYAGAVLAKAPSFFWRLNEPQGATSFADASGNQGPALRPLNGPNGPGPTFAAGTQMAIVGDPGATGVAADTGAVIANPPATVLQAGVGSSVRLPFTIQPPGAGTTGYTVAWWMAHSAPTSAASTFQYILSLGNTRDSGITQAVQVNALDTPSRLQFFASSLTAIGGAQQATVTDSWADGKPHLYVLTMSVNSSTYSLTVYVDGTVVNSPFASAMGTFANPITLDLLEVGGLVNPVGVAAYPAVPGGVYADVGLWNRPLSAAEVADLWNAGRGYPGEMSGARIGRYLGLGYLGQAAIDTGQSVMGASALAEGTNLLDATQGVSLTENGNQWVDGAGTLTFFSRTRRYVAITAQWVFGEQELPYEADIAYDFDPQLIYNDVQVTNDGGIVAQAQDVGSQQNYGPRSLERTINVAADSEAVDASNWLLATHKDPHQRISTFTIKPSANPALWPVALGAEVGDRVTVRRRTLSGYVMQADYFIEQISHAQAPDEWTVQFQMSPAFAQVWLLGDPTYGQLGVTTVLGY